MLRVLLQPRGRLSWTNAGATTAVASSKEKRDGFATFFGAVSCSQLFAYELFERGPAVGDPDLVVPCE